MCLSVYVSLSLSLSLRARVYAYVVSHPPSTYTVVPGFSQHKNACLNEQVLPASPASPAASAKRLTDTPSLVGMQKIAVLDAHLFLLPYPLKGLRAPH